MAKKKDKNNKKKTIIIIVLVIGGVLVIIGIIVALIVANYYRKLDGRECMDCPYVYDLMPADVEILENDLSSRGYSSGFIANVKVGTVHESLKVNGTVRVEYSCKVNYCFEATYIARQCSWNYDVNGAETFELENESTAQKSFTIKPTMDPTSIYMHQNSIDCSFKITETTGKFEIYGERIR